MPGLPTWSSCPSTALGWPFVSHSLQRKADSVVSPQDHPTDERPSSFHILWNHSRECSRFCNKLDYLGILVLMWGAGIPTIYYGFLCDSHLRKLYWTMVSVPVLNERRSSMLISDQTTAFALGCFFITLDPHFASPQYRRWRASMYAGFGLSSIIFVAHGLYVHGWELQRVRMSLNYMIWMGASNLVGAAIYAARVRHPRWQFLAKEYY